MIPRLNITFPLKRQFQYWHGEEYQPIEDEYLLNHARSGIVMALRASLPSGGRVGVVAYNCHTVANAVVNAECTPVFVDVSADLRIEMESVPRDLDAIVVTNLFGIRNDIDAIRKHCPKAIIIVDNAHGFGLPAEGDFTVYSINQGKFPALGEGGLLTVNGDRLSVKVKIDDLYSKLPTYGKLAQVKLFVQMWVKAVAYSKLCYWFVRRLKKGAKPEVHQEVVMKQMAPGIRRLYKTWLPMAEQEIERQKQNAMVTSEGIKELKIECLLGENAFMLIAKTKDPAALQAWFAERGVETATHFSRAIAWATEFGYQHGSCPNAEKLVHELLMVPTYVTLKV